MVTKVRIFKENPYLLVDGVMSWTNETQDRVVGFVTSRSRLTLSVFSERKMEGKESWKLLGYIVKRSHF